MWQSGFLKSLLRVKLLFVVDKLWWITTTIFASSVSEYYKAKD